MAPLRLCSRNGAIMRPAEFSANAIADDRFRPNLSAWRPAAIISIQ